MNSPIEPIPRYRTRKEKPTPVRVWKTTEFYPDGLAIVVNWEAMEVGASIFVPCINTHAAVTQAKQICRKRGWKITSHVRIENMFFGVRIWRTL